jgi:hypothetical protein
MAHDLERNVLVLVGDRHEEEKVEVFSSASSIMHSAGCWLRLRATSATERCGPSTVSNT